MNSFAEFTINANFSTMQYRCSPLVWLQDHIAVELAIVISLRVLECDIIKSRRKRAQLFSGLSRGLFLIHKREAPISSESGERNVTFLTCLVFLCRCVALSQAGGVLTARGTDRRQDNGNRKYSSGCDLLLSPQPERR